MDDRRDVVTSDHERVSVVHEQSGGVAVINVGDGTRHNALRTADWRALERIASEPQSEGLRVVVLRPHSQSASFCAGQDVSEWVGASLETVVDSFTAMEAAFRAVEGIPVPVVAEVWGRALGGGFQLALCADTLLLDPNAELGIPVGRLGIAAPETFVRRVMGKLPSGAARRLLLWGALLSAPEAEVLGLGRMVRDRAALRTECDLLCERLNHVKPPVVRTTKGAIEHTAARSGSVACLSGIPQMPDYDAFQQAIARVVGRKKPAMPDGVPDADAGRANRMA